MLLFRKGLFLFPKVIVLSRKGIVLFGRINGISSKNKAFIMRRKVESTKWYSQNHIQEEWKPYVNIYRRRLQRLIIRRKKKGD